MNNLPVPIAEEREEELVIMTHCLLLIGASPDDPWGQVIRAASDELGQLQITSECDGLKLIKHNAYDLIIVDAAGVAEVNQLVCHIHTQRPETKIVVVTTSPTWKRARDAFRAGAVDYIRKSLDTTKILSTLNALIGKASA